MKLKPVAKKLFCRINSLLLILILLMTSGCGVYSFTGASISPAVKTISISYFPNNAQYVQPTLSQKFTDALRDKFASQTNLTILKSGGDLDIQGAITGYNPTEPSAIQGGADQTAALYRITVTVSVKFTNKKDETQNFETTFSRYEDYDRSKRLADIEDQLLDQINEALVQDIFNKAVVNWN
jgi:outer membrane lipopolysaccharide assembly protein LptE/RlpB